MPVSCEMKPHENIAERGNSGSPPGAKPPSVFNPPYPQMRTGAPEHESESFHQGSRTQKGFRSSSNVHPASNHQVAGVRMNSDYDASFPKKSRSQENISNFSRQGKHGKSEYFRPNDGRNSFEMYQPVERREGSARTEERRSDSDSQYSITRDGPSPGRQYHYSYPSGAPVATEGVRFSETSPPTQQQPRKSTMYRTSNSNRKRKSQDPSTPEGPRLISNQSSDDSINAILPPKRARTGNGLNQDVALMKSFTPLSPIHSRTFSREDPMDMTRFMDPRGSAENLRIFQSWSSGNSPPQEEQTTLDVRNCYNDWQGPPRRANSRSWDDKLPAIQEHEYQRNRVSGSRGHLPASPPRSYETQERYSQRPPPAQGSKTARGESQYVSRSYNRASSSQYCQPLHPEDRCGPYNDQLSRRVPGYSSRESEQRYYEREQGNYQTFVPRRNELDDRSKGHGRRPTSHTPPTSNGWGRYDDYNNPQQMYDSQGAQGPPSGRFDNWGRPYEQLPYGGMHQEPPPTSPIREYTGRHLQSARVEAGPDGTAISMRTANGILLLALPDDKISLSETLCIVRENIEVFIATEEDVKAPAPGRKRPVVVGQVGLRCIHCRIATHQSEKVKRAVCFPSSIKRIYRTVIDMKLDHFKACKFVPVDFKVKLEQLKATNARSTGTTMQYFVQASKRMGMVDGGHGIRFCKPVSGNSQEHHQIGGQMIKSDPYQMPESAMKSPDPTRRRSVTSVPSGVSFSLSMDLSLSGASAGSGNRTPGSSISQASSLKDNVQHYPGKTSLSLPEDKSALSPLRCFLRENAFAFAATAEDIAVRTPTTFSVVVGQVGIGCIHCHKLPAKERTNRAVCFPFSIGRIYQSVADIQRFHMSECKMVPPAVKEKFIGLQRASTKGSKGLATRQYWISSAKKLGLGDTSDGIRFIRDPSIPQEKAVSLDILAQVATDVTTASKPLVLDEDKPQIASFIYLVMKQLQPCRFTEADRNKRRLKDVGCIGVECKHCAGQVDGRKFFWSSVNAVESNFVSVHTHMMECKVISHELKEELAHLKTLRKEHTAKLKTGSQKAFFSRVWRRLHEEGKQEQQPSGNMSQEQAVSSPKVPPQVSVLGNLKSSSSSPGTSFNEIGPGAMSNIYSPNNSFGAFKEEEVPSPLSSSLSGGTGIIRMNSLPNSGNKFPVLPMAMSSPPSSPSESVYLPSESSRNHSSSVGDQDRNRVTDHQAMNVTEL
mmetsp:Transcript_22500/g.33305  ORF Transcript_22500/g.33305 Transcript_22500/m.33305 type:complete len:1223 (+) Transcript_22500:316-3984(+)